MTDQHRFQVNSTGSGCFEAHGEIDAGSAPLLAEQMATSTGEPRLILDMSNVTFMDSSGLRVLLALAERGSSGGSALSIARPSRAVVRLLEISGLTDHFDIVHDVS
jgi:anti-anti-sigma factor